MEAVQGADALALITKWSEFRVPSWDKVGNAMKNKVVFDGRNLYRSETLIEHGYDSTEYEWARISSKKHK